MTKLQTPNAGPQQFFLDEAEESDDEDVDAEYNSGDAGSCVGPGGMSPYSCGSDEEPQGWGKPVSWSKWIGTS